METRINSIQPALLENWVKSPPQREEPRLVQAVNKTEESDAQKLAEDKRKNTNQTGRDKPVPEKMSADSTRGIVEEIKSSLENLNISIRFEVQEKSKDVIVKVMDQDTGKVIRQIPPEDLLKVREKLQELQGVLFEGKA